VTSVSPTPTGHGTVIYPVRFRDSSALLEGLRRSEAAASAELYDRFAPHIRRVLSRILGADPEVPDLLHEVFVQALRSVQSVQDGARLKGWLTTIAVYTARGCIRKRQRYRWLGFRDPQQLPPIEGANADPEVLEALRTVYLVLEHLPADLRIPFSLRYVDKMELTEVAEACHVSLATVKRRLSKAERRFVQRARREPSLVPWVQKHPRWRDL